jgi:hypothetical protein
MNRAVAAAVIYRPQLNIAILSGRQQSATIWGEYNVIHGSRMAH